MARSLPSAKEAAETWKSLPQIKRWREKDFELGSWFTSDPHEAKGAWGSWGRQQAPSKRGMSFIEMNRNSPSPVPPEAGAGLVVDREGGAPPGADRYEYPLNKKYEVWSDNVVSLYEEAVSRQWSATKDIPWDQLEPLPVDQERALCQFLCFLHAIEFIPTDTIPYYMARIDPAFPEVRLYMATQCADESRHMEVFIKRMFANGGGPGVEPTAASLLQQNPESTLPPELQLALVNKVSAEFLAFSYALQMMGEAMVLDFFRFGEFLGRNPCDKEIFRRVLQDEARHVSFGTMRIKYFLDHAPKDERERALEMLHFLASINEAGAGGFLTLTNPSAIEPFALLAAGSVGNIDKGWDTVREFWAMAVHEYLGRCERAGFPRWDKCLMPQEAPF